MHTIDICYYQSPVGEMILGVYKDQLCLADWRYRKMRSTIDQRIQTQLGASFRQADQPVHQECKLQLSQYFLQERQQFDLNINPVGTEFQQEVWRGLMNIDYGSTCSYQQLADKLGRPKASRAIANANGANALAIIIPCHRVIGQDGALRGYAGGLDAKRKLLQIESDLLSGHASHKPPQTTQGIS